MSGVKRFEAHYLTEGVMGGKGLARAEMILASDYDACASRLHEVAEVCAIAEQERDALRAQVEAMRALIDTPHTDEWFEAVRLEAAHQIKRWGTDHDAGKAAGGLSGPVPTRQNGFE